MVLEANEAISDEEIAANFGDSVENLELLSEQESENEAKAHYKLNAPPLKERKGNHKGRRRNDHLAAYHRLNGTLTIEMLDKVQHPQAAKHIYSHYMLWHSIQTCIEEDGGEAARARAQKTRYRASWPLEYPPPIDSSYIRNDEPLERTPELARKMLADGLESALSRIITRRLAAEGLKAKPTPSPKLGSAINSLTVLLERITDLIEGIDVKVPHNGIKLDSPELVLFPRAALRINRLLTLNHDSTPRYPGPVPKSLYNRRAAGLPLNEINRALYAQRYLYEPLTKRELDPGLLIIAWPKREERSDYEIILSREHIVNLMEGPEAEANRALGCYVPVIAIPKYFPSYFRGFPVLWPYLWPWPPRPELVPNSVEEDPVWNEKIRFARDFVPPRTIPPEPASLPTPYGALDGLNSEQTPEWHFTCLPRRKFVPREVQYSVYGPRTARYPQYEDALDAKPESYIYLEARPPPSYLNQLKILHEFWEKGTYGPINGMPQPSVALAQRLGYKYPEKMQERCVYLYPMPVPGFLAAKALGYTFTKLSGPPKKLNASPRSSGESESMETNVRPPNGENVGRGWFLLTTT